MIGEYAKYNPKLPLDQQVEAVEKGASSVVNLLGLPYKFGAVAFKPLNIGGKLYDIILHVNSDIDSSDKEGGYFYDEYTFTIKTHEDNSVIAEEVSSEDIEENIKAIYQKNISQ